MEQLIFSVICNFSQGHSRVGTSVFSVSYFNFSSSVTLVL